MVEQTLLLSSPKAQPFGLLSNKSVLDFRVGAVAVPDANYSFKHGCWKTVNQYVYVNMFKTEKYRHLMSEMLAHPFDNMLRLREQEDVSIYNDASIKGLRERFRQRAELRDRLYQTRGKQLVHDNKHIIVLLNQLRLQDQQAVYDPKQKKEVPRTEVLQVISGVEDELSINPSLPDLDFVDLKKYAKRTYKDLPLDDEIFLDINHIVPVVKYRVRERIWKEEQNRFKDHLLDVFLDHILEEHYPNVGRSEYTQAKQQQIAKEPRLQVYKDQLYQLYDARGKDYDVIFNRLRFTPDKTRCEMRRNARQIKNKLLATPETETDILGTVLRDMEDLNNLRVPPVMREKIYIQQDDPFLPHYLEDVIIDGKKYASAVHYAYAQMIVNLIKIGELDGLNMFDVNTVALENLVGTYNTIKRDWINHNLKANNEVAIGMKMKQYPTLVHLLLSTGDTRIIWNDKTDPVLGVGSDNNGDNNMGYLLMYVRDAYKNMALENRLISSYGSIAANIWTNSWMMSTAQDLKNTMILLKNPSTSDLEIIYNFDHVNINISPTRDDVQTLYLAGLNDVQISIAFPVIAAMYMPMRNKTEQQLMNDEANAYFNENDYRGRKNDFMEDLEYAITRLTKVYERVELADRVDKRKFVYSILANIQTSNKDDARWNRVYKWSH